MPLVAPALRWPGKETARLDWKPGHRLSMMLLQAGLAYAVVAVTGLFYGVE